MRNTYLQMCDYGSRFRILKGGKISMVVSAFIAGATLLHAAPSGGVVTSGVASIAQSGVVTTVNQNSQKASINWQNFSIAGNETVNFNQPSASAITLNRVVGNEKSIINGALNANGQVWILNSNGVLFNANAKVNTSGLLATTKALSDEDFQNGVYSFKGSSTASVVNLGEITINNGGYASLLANTASNEGTIKAIQGFVTLTGANEATINLNGNSLVSLKVDKGVLDALVENKGAIVADGGHVYLTTNAVNELLKGVVNNTGIIEAKSMDDLKSEVILYAHGGTANVSGTIDATGGFVETSGKELSVIESTVIKTKKWLIDPENVTIESSGGAIGTSSVSASAIETALVTADVEIQATNDITVNEAIDIHTVNDDGYTVGGLTLIAGNDININEVITIGPEAYLALNHGWNGTEWDGSNEATVYGNGGKITFGMNETKTDFAGKVVFADNENTHLPNNSIYINEVEQTLIRDISDLQTMQQTANGVIGNSTDRANALKGNYVLAADIDMNGELWAPIGKAHQNYNDYSLDFKGTFNGLGHTISNLTLNGAYEYPDNSAGQSAGLFGSIATIYDVGTQTQYKANISSIRLSNASITNTADNREDWDTSTGATAALVGSARANEEQIGLEYVTLSPTIHNNIVTSSTIEATGDGGSVGAIVGGAYGAIISDNAVTDTTLRSVSDYSVGGIVGSARDTGIIDSYVSDSTIKSAYGEVGGIAGYMNGSAIVNAISKNNTIQADGTLQGSYGAGGIAGYIDEGSKIIDSAAEGNTIAAMQDAGGIVGYLEDSNYDLEGNEPSTVSNSFYNLTNTKIGDNTADATQNSFGIITLGAVDSADYSTWLNADKTTPTLSSVFGAAVNGYYTINNNSDFRKMLAFAYDPDAKFKLASSFTLDNGLYLPLFKGELDGNGKTISGLNVSQSYNSNIGLIGRLFGGTVKNLTLTSPTLDGYAYVGAVAGNAQGGAYVMYDDDVEYTSFPTLSNITVNNFTFSHTADFTVTTQHISTSVNNIGAIAGYADGTTMSNLTTSGTIGIDLTADNEGYDSADIYSVGGLFGAMTNSSLNTASSSVAITLAMDSVDSTNNEGNEINAGGIGGLAGSVHGSVMQNVSASGSIVATMTNNDVDDGDSEIYRIGGLAGNLNDSYIKTASSTNTITINGNAELSDIGGLSGDSSSSLYDGATTSGAITLAGSEAYSIGGMIGSSSENIIKNATSTRNITITTEDDYVENIGGLLGNADTTNIDAASYVGTIDVGEAEGENIGGLVGYSYGDISDLEFAYFGKIISATTTPENEAQRTADTTALRDAYNARADVIALKALGYTVEEQTGPWGSETGPYHVSFNIVTPDNTEWGVITDSTATVNIKAENAYGVGGLVGKMDSEDGGQIIDSSVVALGGTGKVLGGSGVGGLVGYNGYGNISGSHTAIEVVGSSSGERVGGLVGYNEGADRTDWLSVDNINNSFHTTTYNTQEEANAALASVKQAYIDSIAEANPDYEYDSSNGDIYVTQYYGESVYRIYGRPDFIKSQATGTITNSYATGKVTGGGNVGGLVGYNYNDGDGGAAITGSYASGAVVGTDNVGGLVGYNEYAMLDTVYSTGTVNGNNNVGGLVGYAEGSEIIDSRHTLGKVTGIDSNPQDGGAIGGLVGRLVESSIQNSYATSEVVGEVAVGGLVGGAESDSTIVDSYATGKVTASGLVNNLSHFGFAADEIISMAGGFIGFAGETSIENSYATGEVVGKGMLGGFAGGISFSELIGSYATGKVTGTNGLGGFVGLSLMSNISQSYSTGVVSGTAATGVDGVTAGNMVGGFMGRSIDDTIEESYTTSNVMGATNVGGFAGKVSDETTIADTYAQGSVTASGNNVGSFAGALDGSSVTNSYASGKINQTGSNQMSVKGFVGNLDGTITNSFYDKTVNAGMADEELRGKTTTELKTLATYTDELGDSFWDMGGENGHYPILGFQTEGAETTWVMTESSTPTPEPTPEFVQLPKIIDAIVSGVAIQPPVMPTFVQPNIIFQAPRPQTFSFGGQPVQLMSTPLGDTPTQIISLDEIRQMQQESAGGTDGVRSPDIRIPLGQNSLIQLVNGGLNLPAGIEQEFFMAQR